MNKNNFFTYTITILAVCLSFFFWINQSRAQQQQFSASGFGGALSLKQSVGEFNMPGVKKKTGLIGLSAADSGLNRKRFALIMALNASGLIGSYIYVQNVWWANQKGTFHFDQDLDYRYAKNLDKVAHFVGGQVSAELFDASLNWAGMSAERSLIYSGLFGVFIHVGIELKDAFAPTYGFSWGDISAGSAGSFLPLLKYKVKAFDAITTKISYYRHHNYYFNFFKHADVIDDYMNQTYWAAISLNDWLPKQSKTEKWYPDFLCLVVGMGIDETWNNYFSGNPTYADVGKGNYEWYLSFDVDWRKIIKPHTRFRKAMAYSLNYIKLPLPTLRVSPSAEFYWGFW